MLFACSQCSVLFGGMDLFKWKTLHVSRIKTIAIEIYKILHSVNPGRSSKKIVQEEVSSQQI